MAKSEKLEFQTEVSQLLKLMINSVYSEKEVFIRELVSNASDACDKLRYLSNTKEKLLKDDPNFSVSINIDKKSNLISISDNGVGMNKKDLISNLGTIARSGTAHFLKELSESKTKDLSLIGQFGVGFYSAFMVASQTKVVTRKAGENKVWIWVSDGESNFTIEESENLDLLPSNRGTTIELTLIKEAKEYLEKSRIESIIRKYSDHISIPIFITDGSEKKDEKPESVNSASAIWTRPKNKITEDQYKEFIDDKDVTNLYVTRIKGDYNCDTFFPQIPNRFTINNLSEYFSKTTNDNISYEDAKKEWIKIYKRK